MLKVFFLLIMMICMFSFLSMLEIMIFFSLLILFFIMMIDWESLWMNYVLELFSLDMMSVNLIILSLWIMLLMVMASFNLGVFNSGEYSFYLLLMMFLLFMCFSCSNLLVFFIFFESVLFPIIMMIFNWGFQPERLQAGIYMLFYTLFGSLPLLICLMFNSFSLNFIYLFFCNGDLGSLFFFLIVVAFLVKVPMFFLHLWLPKAHVEAPVFGSMILAGVLLKLGIFGLYRFKLFILDYMEMYAAFMISIALLGGVMVSIICLEQVDLKSLIAYSSICHMSLTLGGFFVSNNWGGNGALLMMIGHGLCSSALFCLANLMYERVYTRSLMLMKGLGIIFPFLMVWWFFFSVVNMSAPPTMNFFAEIMLMGSMMKYSFILIVPLFFLSFFSACYSLYIYSYTQHGSGWLMYSVQLINMREYFLMLFHFFPLVLWFLNVNFFMNWL
uniref:NADH-ubiquinone oxidoreductase chain 4 n=1 Tax=Argas africolumbae TaxID=1210872 RepID=K7QM19_ARGAF|nr:NADH dehydrogenase subunit 4 [Argas africolumbae]AFV32073.1 NADH dehydrogenase subunit 4 [Argas africolumbae]UYL27192.1 NADH dehydrogenase subunit 4 [Argas africolumbae]